jgi:hypothetical protein
MLSFHQLVVLLAFIQGFQYGTKDINMFCLSPLRIIVIAIDIMTELFIRVFIAYNFPKLFMIFTIVSDKYIQSLFKYLITNKK